MFQAWWSSAWSRTERMLERESLLPERPVGVETSGITVNRYQAMRPQSQVTDGRPLQLCLPRDPALSLISATAWMPILEQRDPWEEKWVVGSISFSNGTEVLDRA